MSLLYFEIAKPKPPLLPGQWNRTDPWMIRDGAWMLGSWVTQPWAGHNVFERSLRTNEDGIREHYWRCVWDNVLKMWRSITDWEHSKLPALPVYEEHVGGFDKWVFPVIAKINLPSILPDLVSVQPMAGPAMRRQH